MYCVHYVLFILSLCVYSGLCNRKPCFYEDTKCLLDLAKENQPIIVDGVPGEIETSDPLHVDQVSGDLPEMTFKLKNITLRGLRDCHPVLAKIDLKKSLFDFSLDCDVLHVTKEYEIHGRKAGIPAEATGVNTVTMHDCSFEMNGELNLSTKFEITDFQVKISVKGEVEIGHKNSVEAASLSKEDREQWKIIEELFRPVLMKSLLSKYYKNINDYIKLKPLDITFE